jgi:hypothetical protein
LEGWCSVPAEWYLVPATLTAVAFVAMETRRPWCDLKPQYPWGLACLSWMVWASAAVMGLAWPFFWLTGGPEMVREQFRPSERLFKGVLADQEKNREVLAHHGLTAH